MQLEFPLCTNIALISIKIPKNNKFDDNIQMTSARLATTIIHGSYSGKKVTEGLNSDCVWVAVLPRNMASDPDKIWFLVRGEISQSCAWKYGKRTVLDVMRITMYL